MVRVILSLVALLSTNFALGKRSPFDLLSLSNAMKDPAFAKAVDLFLENRFADLGSVCEGRLTIESGTPYEMLYLNGATTIYFTPFNGSAIGLYTGTRWQLLNFSETSLTPALSASKIYDVFGYDNSGTLALELSAAWSSSTVRTDALTTVGGVYVKSTNNTRRYLGTIAANAGAQLDDTINTHSFWNHCNRRRTHMVIEGTTFHTYDGGYRFFNGDSTRQITVVVGLTSGYEVMTEFGRAASVAGYAGIGLDSSTVPLLETGSNELAQYASTNAMVAGVLTQGTHSFNMINSTNSSGNMDVYYQKIQGWLEY